MRQGLGSLQIYFGYSCKFNIIRLLMTRHEILQSIIIYKYKILNKQEIKAMFV